MATQSYFRVTFLEIEMLLEIVDKLGEDSPYRLTQSLFVTRKKGDIFSLERHARLLDSSMKYLSLAKVSLDSLRGIFPVLKMCNGGTTPEDAKNQLEQLYMDIGRKYNFTVPTEEQLIDFYSEERKDRTDFFSIELDLILNFKNYLRSEMFKFFCTIIEDNKFVDRELVF